MVTNDQGGSSFSGAARRLQIAKYNSNDPLLGHWHLLIQTLRGWKAWWMICLTKTGRSWRSWQLMPSTY